MQTTPAGRHQRGRGQIDLCLPVKSDQAWQKPLFNTAFKAKNINRLAAAACQAQVGREFIPSQIGHILKSASLDAATGIANPDCLGFLSVAPIFWTVGVIEVL